MDAANLHALMEAALVGNKRDVYDYTAGHLNFNRYNRNVTNISENKVRWKCCEKQTPETTKKPPLAVKKNINKMSDALFNFSAGTAGALAADNSSMSIHEDEETMLTSTASQEQLEKSLFEEMQRFVWKTPPPSVSSQTQHDAQLPKVVSRQKKVLPPIKRSSKVVCEELKLPEIMLPTTDDTREIPMSLQGGNTDNNKKYERAKFITTYHAGVSAKDQFQKMVDFERTVLRKPETLEQKLGDGHKAVEHLEQKLVSRLMEFRLKNIHHGLSFHRLQLYSEIWNDMSLDSTIFGELLNEIKEEYDSYLVHLIDSSQSTNRAELAQCLELIKGMSSHEKVEMSQQLQEEVENLEEKCKTALLRNHELRKKVVEENARIEKEKRLQREEDEENIRRMLPVRRNHRKVQPKSRENSLSGRKSKLKTEQKLQLLHSEIWDKLDHLSEQRELLRNSFVPKQSHRNVQHAVKDTEVEIQKLQQQTEYLTQHKQVHVNKLETELKRSIVSQDVRRKNSVLGEKLDID
uniref:uncharacterized protein C6orf118-like isoform X2 n=1 Tax=Ciona intestinalis TaxID=7719 RepID=UPI000EF4C361|nr:uncharacterized protein C6orf118-like isoform X2 [Ciona intestinalis]|eukprot:XP_026692914.1 uncharacterized protein C6orf118-like isoform X2 [Ciona intestinalis]